MKKSLISLMLILSVVSNGRATATLVDGHIPDNVENFFRELAGRPQAMVEMYNTFQVNGERDIDLVAIPRTIRDNTQPDDAQILQLYGTINLVTATDDGSGTHTFAQFTPFVGAAAVTQAHFSGDGQAGDIIPAAPAEYAALINQDMLDALKTMRGGERLVAIDVQLLVRIRLQQALAQCVESVTITAAHVNSGALADGDIVVNLNIGVGANLIPYTNANDAVAGASAASQAAYADSLGAGNGYAGHIVENVEFAPGSIILNYGQQIAGATNAGVLQAGVVVDPTLDNLRNYTACTYYTGHKLNNSY